MASYVTISFDTPAFDKAFRELYATSKRSLADFTNKKAYYITLSAILKHQSNSALTYLRASLECFIEASKIKGEKQNRI